MSEFSKEFDYVISKGWWFSIIPKSGKWRCSIYKKMPDKKWNAQETKMFPNIIQGMIWIEAYLEEKLDQN